MTPKTKLLGCLEGCLLSTFAVFVLAMIAAALTPNFITYRDVHPQHGIKESLKSAYKECAVSLARDGHALAIRDLGAIKHLTSASRSNVLELDKSDQFDLNAD